MLLLLLLLNRRRRRRANWRSRQVWMKKWLMRRSTQGAYTTLIKELDAEDPEKYRQFHRLDRQAFEDVLATVGPLITNSMTAIFVVCGGLQRKFLIVSQFVPAKVMVRVFHAGHRL